MVEPVTTQTPRSGARVSARGVALWRVRAVVPCHNRPGDLSRLLSDLAGLDLGTGRAALSVIVVDNASEPPLQSAAPLHAGLSPEFVRLERNAGGSGGFNAGFERVLGGGVPGDACELVWLLDSDVRVEPAALLPLVEALEQDPTLAAAGSVLTDPATGRAFEGGGWIDRWSGEYRQERDPGWERDRVVPAEYLAACSMLVRRSALEQAGPMADYFVNGDDVEWCLRMARRTGLRLAAVPASRVSHPPPDRMRTWARYYATRNAQHVLAAAGAGRWARLARGLRDTGRAAAQTLVGRDDLAALHLAGLRDALAGVAGAAPEGRLRHEPWRALSELPGAVRQVLAMNRPRGRVLLRRGVLADPGPLLKALNAACVNPSVQPDPPRTAAGAAIGGVFRRLAGGPPWGVAIVSARARAADWLAGRVIVTVAPEGFMLRRISAVERGVRLAGVLARGAGLSAVLAVRRARRIASPTAPPGPRLSLSVVILSCNRSAALERTLRRLLEDPAANGAEVFVADNDSTDGTHEMLRRFPSVRVVAQRENTGIAAFNRAARMAGGQALLILDDDAAPAEGALERAMDLLSRRPDLGAVALHPRHPETGVSEWPFGEGAAPTDEWPVMGCGNLVRRAAWERVGGYCEPFFLYRNDADLAMSLLAAGWGVHFDPSLVVHHESAAAAHKPRRWFDLATRNWIWVSRRHGRGLSKAAAIAAGVLNAHRLAGRDAGAHLAVWRGVLGALRRPPATAPGMRRDGAALRRLLRLRFGRTFGFRGKGTS